MLAEASSEASQNTEGAERASKILARLYLPLIVLLLAVCTWRPLQGGEDFWAHIATGRWIWQNQSVPHETLWLWSTPPQPWIAHSWLSELFLYGLMRAGGTHLVLLVTIIFVALPFVWFWKVWAQRGRVSALTPVFFAFAIWCTCVRFQPRPELFSYFFLCLLLVFLMEWPRSATPPKMFGIVALFALWANCHGAVALGILILLLTAACELVQQKFARPAWKLVWLLIGCVLAINLNPYGIAYWKALKPVGGAMFKMIDEWKPPLTAPALPFMAVAFIFFIALVALSGWIKNPERRWSHLLWLVLGFALFVTARRNLWPCVLISLAVSAGNAHGLSTFRSFEFTAPVRMLTRGIAVAILLAFASIMIVPEALSFERGMPRLRSTSPVLPRRVADMVLSRQLPNPVFNDYLRSGYFHWRFAGKPPLYIDLQNAYPPALLGDYFDVIKRTPRGQAEFDKLDVNTVIFGTYKDTDRLAPMASFLNQSPHWQQIYRGSDGAVWVRRSALARPQSTLPTP